VVVLQPPNPGFQCHLIVTGKAIKLPLVIFIYTSFWNFLFSGTFFLASV